MNHIGHRLFIVFTLGLGLNLLTSSLAAAFLYQIPILDKKQITQFSDETLFSTYIDVLVEIEASQAFHQTSGFTPKQYQQHKDLLKYRILLVDEIQKRGLDVPGTVKIVVPPPPEPPKSEPKKSTLLIKNQ